MSVCPDCDRQVNYYTSVEQYSHCMGLRFIKELKLFARVEDSVLH